MSWIDLVCAALGLVITAVLAGFFLAEQLENWLERREREQQQHEALPDNVIRLFDKQRRKAS